jgi:hypothetical protein
MIKIYPINKMCSSECVENLMINLRVIGKIEPGFKINTKETHLELDNTTQWQFLLRWYRGDSRYTTIGKIHSIITNSSHIINQAINDFTDKIFSPMEMYLNNTPEGFLKIMLNILLDTEIGLKNLRDTYKQYITTSSKLEMEIESTNRQINSIKKLFNS